jgi:hypothetical protein
MKKNHAQIQENKKKEPKRRDFQKKNERDDGESARATKNAGASKKQKK